MPAGESINAEEEPGMSGEGNQDHGSLNGEEQHLKIDEKQKGSTVNNMLKGLQEEMNKLSTKVSSLCTEMVDL